jgi:hypothetical protein
MLRAWTKYFDTPTISQKSFGWRVRKIGPRANSPGIERIIASFRGSENSARGAAVAGDKHEGISRAQEERLSLLKPIEKTFIVPLLEKLFAIQRLSVPNGLLFDGAHEPEGRSLKEFGFADVVFLTFTGRALLFGQRFQNRHDAKISKFRSERNPLQGHSIHVWRTNSASPNQLKAPPAPAA